MEIVIVLIVIGVIAVIVFAVNSKDDGPSYNKPYSPGRTRAPKSAETAFRVVEKTVTADDGYSFDVLNFEMRGMIPFNVSGRMSYLAISLYDDQERLPVMSLLDTTQEDQTRFFMYSQPFEAIPSGSGFTDWVSIGYAVKESLIPPRSGQRQLRTVYRFIRPGTQRDINQGQIDDRSDIYYERIDPNPSVSEPSRFIKLNFAGVGYLEAGENAETAQKMALRLGFSMALIDGELHEAEGLVIKQWLTKFVEDYQDDDEKERVKAEMNSAMEQEYESALQGTIDRDKSIKTLLETGQKIDHYETLELLMDIMAADSSAHRSELVFVDYVGTKLGISTREIQDMKSMKIIGNESLTIDSSLADQQLGIDSSMPKEKICKHIQEEFLLWNSRIQAQNEGPDRDYAQSMIDMLAEAKIKYCG